VPKCFRKYATIYRRPFDYQAGKNGAEGKNGTGAPEAAAQYWHGGYGGTLRSAQSRIVYANPGVAAGCAPGMGSPE
jgi:hypothetical protein